MTCLYRDSGGAGHFLCFGLFVTIMRTALQNLYTVIVDPENDPVAVIDTFAPPALQISAQRFRLSDPAIPIPVYIMHKAD